MRKLWFASVAACALAASAEAWAADAAPSTELETVVVTAEKRSVNLQTVPITVEAVQARDLAATGVDTTQALQALVPGLVFNNNLTGGIPYIRGIGQSTGILGPENPVAMYLDGVYLTAPQSASFSFNNVNRIEVLKGPQGTLFGRNTTGGVIQVITKDPTNTPTADVTAGYGRFGTFTGQFYGSIGVADGLSTNLALYGQDRTDGFVRNIALNKEIYTRKTFGVQNKWRYANENTEVILNLFYTYDRGYEGNTFGVAPGSVADNKVSRYLGRNLVALSLDTPSTNSQSLGALTLRHDLGWAKVSSVTAYHRLTDAYHFVQNAIPNGPPGSAADQYVKQADSTFTQELQIQAPSGEDFQWIAGAFYLHDRAHILFELLPNGARTPALLGDTAQVIDSEAVYAQATKTILPKTRLTLGLRWTHDQKTLSGLVNFNGIISTPGNPNGLGTLAPLEAEKAWENYTYRAALDHAFTDRIFGYISLNHGFKSGQYNISSFTNPPVSPETVDAYEVGVKSDLFDRRVRLNISGFDNIESNAQLRRVGITPGTILLLNAGKLHAEGIDVDFTALVAPGLTLRAGGSFLRAVYTSLKGAPLAHPNPTTFANIPSNCATPATLPSSAATSGGNTTLICDLSGNSAIRSPHFSGAFGLDYERPLADRSRLDFTVNDQYNSGFYWDPDNRLRQRAYHNVSASVKWTAPSARWDVMLWVANLFNADMWNTATAGSTDTYSPGMPRTYGVTIGAHF